MAAPTPDADANLDTEQQLTDIETFINQDVDVLILLAQDNEAVLPGVQAAKDAGIPVIAYDRLIEDPELLYITFDNVAWARPRPRPCSRRCRRARTS